MLISYYSTLHFSASVAKPYMDNNLTYYEVETLNDSLKVYIHPSLLLKWSAMLLMYGYCECFLIYKMNRSCSVTFVSSLLLAKNMAIVIWRNLFTRLIPKPVAINSIACSYIHSYVIENKQTLDSSLVHSWFKKHGNKTETS